MKKMLLAVMPVFLLLTSFISAYAPDKNNPKEVAYNYTVAVNKLDFEEAKKYGTAETGKLLDMLSVLSGMMPDSIKAQAKTYKVEVKDIIEKDDKCMVMVTNGEDKVEKINLIKENDLWKVHMSKEGMGESEEAEKMDEDK